MCVIPDNQTVYIFMWWLTFMWNTVNWPLISALKWGEGLLGRPGGGGRLLSHRGGLDEAAVEGVLWVVVGYWERKTNAEAKRSFRGFWTVLQEQQSVLTQSQSRIVESIGLCEPCGRKKNILVFHVNKHRLKHYGILKVKTDILIKLSIIFTFWWFFDKLPLLNGFNFFPKTSWLVRGMIYKKYKPFYLQNAWSVRGLTILLLVGWQLYWNYKQSSYREKQLKR